MRRPEAAYGHQRQELVGYEHAALPVLAISPSTSRCSTGYNGTRTILATKAELRLFEWRWSSPTSFGGLTVPQRGQ
jgi:hypothetical protein